MIYQNPIFWIIVLLSNFISNIGVTDYEMTDAPQMVQHFSYQQRQCIWIRKYKVEDTSRRSAILSPNCTFTSKMDCSSRKSAATRFFGGRPACSGSCRHMTVYRHLCSQCMKFVIDRYEIPKLQFMELCQPFARFVILGTLWSKWVHKSNVNGPTTQVRLM